MNIRYLLNSHSLRKRLFVVLVISVLFFILILSRLFKDENCFDLYTFTDDRTLPEVVNNKLLTLHKSSKNIFFHETSCNPCKPKLNINYN